MLSSFIIFCRALGSVGHFYNFILPTDAVLNKNSIKYLQDNATAVKSGEIAVKNIYLRLNNGHCLDHTPIC